MKRNYLFVLIFIIQGNVILSFGQESTNHIFQIQNKSFDNYPELSIDFSIYHPHNPFNFLDTLHAGNVQFFENGTFIDSSSFQSIREYDKYNLFIVTDFSSKKDSARLLENIEKVAQFSLSDSIQVDSWLMLQKQDSVVGLALPEVAGLTKKDTFSLTITDSLFSKFINENHLVSGKNIFVFILDNDSPEEQNLFSGIAHSGLRDNAPLIGLLNLSENPMAPDVVKAKAGNLPYVLKNGMLERKTEDINMAPLIEGWMRKNYRLTFQTTEPLALDPYKEYQIIIREDTLSFHLNIPSAVIEEHYKAVKMQQIKSFINAEKYEDALSLIIETNSKLKTVEFDSLAWSVIGMYGEQLAENKAENSLDKYLAFESRWSETPPDDYAGKRLQLFKNYYQNLKAQPELYKKKAELAQTIYNVEPTSENEFNLTVDEAWIFYSENKNWEALEKLHDALEIKNTDETNQLFREWLLHTFKTDFENKKFTNLAEKGEFYKKWFAEPFRQNFILAEAYRETHDFINAQKQYEWLIDNWRNQNIIDWFGAFGKLQEMLCLNYKFDEAIEINQRLYRSKENNESVELSLFNARAKMLKPAIDIFPETVKQLGSFASLISSVQLKPVVFPDWLAGIVLTDSNMKPIAELYKTEDFKPNAHSNLNRFKNFPVVEMDIAGNNFWLINRINANQYIVFHIANDKRNEQEKIILDEIVKVKMDETNWINLFRLEESTGIKFSTRLMAALWEAEMAKKGSVAFTAYWSKLKTNDFVRFLTFHSEKGDVKNYGKPIPKNNYPAGDYERSLKAVAYFEQVIKDANRTFFDITNPVFNESTWKGAVRLGVESYYE